MLSRLLFATVRKVRLRSAAALAAEFSNPVGCFVPTTRLCCARARL
jgi:hypothetical protein